MHRNQVDGSARSRRPFQRAQTSRVGEQEKLVSQAGQHSPGIGRIQAQPLGCSAVHLEDHDWARMSQDVPCTPEYKFLGSFYIKLDESNSRYKFPGHHLIEGMKGHVFEGRLPGVRRT